MKIKSIGNGLLIFDNEEILRDYHEPDCDERVYVDFNYLYNYDLKDVEFSETEDIISIESGSGIYIKDINDNKYFIPCYNEQPRPGFYSNNLFLHTFKDGNVRGNKDISKASQLVEV